MNMYKFITEMTNSYVETALWSSTDDDGHSLDDMGNEVAPVSLREMKKDCLDFISELRKSDLLSDLVVTIGAKENEYPVAEMIGHDFWLTRNGHGAGFWDRGYGPIGDTVSDICKHSGERYLQIGDDGLIHQH